MRVSTDWAGPLKLLKEKKASVVHGRDTAIGKADGISVSGEAEIAFGQARPGVIRRARCMAGDVLVVRKCCSDQHARPRQRYSTTLRHGQAGAATDSMRLYGAA
ncbi:hypothetical protein ACJBU6_08954 [Exserohilum turcicum]